MSTKIIPTNKKGEIYYGPRTHAEAIAIIRDNQAPAQAVHDALKRGGWTGVAARIAKEYGLA